MPLIWNDEWLRARRREYAKLWAYHRNAIHCLLVWLPTQYGCSDDYATLVFHRERMHAAAKNRAALAAAGEQS
jgi:hypothetical protein